MERSGTAKGHEYEVAWIETSLDGDHANSGLHIGIDDADNAQCCLLWTCTEAFSDGCYCFVRLCSIERHRATEECLWNQSSQHNVSIGYGGFRSSTTIGSGSGDSACRSWTDS